MENNSLVKISLGISVLLTIAVVILFVKMPSGASADAEEIDSSKVEFSDDAPTRIAYFSNDSLNMNCQFVIDVQEDAEKVNVDAQKKLESKQYEIQQWQKKWESKGELLEREYIKAQEEGAKLQEELMSLQQNLQMEVGQKTEQLMMTMYNRMSIYAKGFCEKNEIDMLVGYSLGGDIYYVNPKMDVTGQFINYANKEYAGGGATDVSAEAGE